MLLNHFLQWTSSGRFSLILLRGDATAQTRYIYADLTNQNLSQVNYVNDLVSVSNEFRSNWFLLNVNAVSIALKRNIPHTLNVTFLDGGMSPERNGCGHDFFYLLLDLEEGNEPFGYVPQVNYCMSITEFEHGYYLNN